MRVTVPGHYQRGGRPVPYDRVYASRVGCACAELILHQQYGYLVGLKNNELVAFPLSEVANRLKYCEPSGDLVRAARNLGVYMGDEVIDENGKVAWPHYEPINTYEPEYIPIHELVDRHDYRPLEYPLKKDLKKKDDKDEDDKKEDKDD